MYSKIIKNYNLGILTPIVRKSFFLKLKKKFDERFSIIGDFDLFLRLSKLCIFESIQKPLACYRIHGKNLSISNKEKEIVEQELWLAENKSILEKDHFKILLKTLQNRKFINYKIAGEYNQCLKILFNLKINLFSIKNLIILVTPIFLLKKILWYHQE